jgi:predicted TIM-barrel fold metal-dependent hydrolase
MNQLAACPNAVVKLGGIGMDTYVFRTGWSSRARPPGSDDVVKWWGDDIRWCIDTFGPSRCMFVSNYPFDRDAIGYTVSWNGFQKIAAGYPDAEQNDLFSGTAARVYRIGLDAR